MPKAEAGSTKAISNKMKSKGLGRLRWYCQACERQMRDENGFKCHVQSESHVRQVLLIGEDPRKHIEDYSKQFERDFLQLLRTTHGEKSVNINHFYQQLIADKEHIHMNATKWPSLTEYAKHLGREGICRVEESEKGIFVAWIDNSPETLRRREALMKKERQDRGDEEREQQQILEQIQRANRGVVAGEDGGEGENEEAKQLQRKEGEKVKLNFGGKIAAAGGDKAKDLPARDGSSGEGESTGTPAESTPEPTAAGASASQDVAAPKVKIGMSLGDKKPKNVFAAKKNALGGKKTVVKEAPKKMSEQERIMKADMEAMSRKRMQSNSRCEMDVAALRDRIQSTLDTNADTRRQAELDLKYAEEQPGFPNALLDILQGEQESGVRLSTVVYLKNRINRGWAPPADQQAIHKPIPDDERVGFRNRLIPTLASSQPQVRSQLVPVLQKVLQHDFPEQWPDFMDLTVQLLNTNDANSVFAGLQCLLAICRVYRFRAGEKRTDFDKIVEISFPQLLNIGNGLVEETSLEAAEMLRIVVKAYKHAIYFELPPHLMEHQVTVNWCTLFLRIIGKEIPANTLPDDPDEREQNHWWKSKKWAYANLNRLFIRYGNPTTITKNSTPDYTQFSKTFISTFAPEILKGYLNEIDKWVSKGQWLSKPALSYTLIFLEECVKPKLMWDNLKPHMENLISHLIFPILCQSDEDIELFESDPSEYLHRKLNAYEEVGAPDVAATNFLVALTKSRKKQTFSILTFVNGVVSKYESAPEDQKQPREKEGALRMIGSLASVILGKKSPIADQVEYFFVRHVFPEFRSPHGFLRARACDTLEKFEQLDFKDPNNLMVIYRNILDSMADPELPVRVEASLALQPLIRHDVIRASMQQNIPQIMQQLLKLANEVDVDALANVMEDFVEVFSTELTPFAVALSEQLRDTYMRIIRDILERNNTKGDDEAYGDFLDDKSITALGVLQTIGTLILTLESTPDVLLHLETILMPVITITLENKLYDLYNEVFEIIDSCTFAAKRISPTMWQAFELVHKTFKAGAELYLEDMLPALDNYVQYGSDMLIQNPSYLRAVVGMVEDIFHDEKVGGVDRICGCKLAETLMLNLRGHIDPYVPVFINLAMGVILNGEVKARSYRIHLMEMVINSIYYNPHLALQVLESNDWTNKFFSAWFSSIEMFKRVHDKKLSIAAISSLLTLRAGDVPTSVQQGWPRLLQGVTRLFQTLPAALKQREEATQESDFTLEDDHEGIDEDNDWTGEVEWTDRDEAEGPDQDVADESAAYLEFLDQEAQKFSNIPDDDNDELNEESLLETPLDKVDPYVMFKHVLMDLQQQQPELYESLTKILNPDEQQVIQSVVQEADDRAAVIAAAAAGANAEAVASPTNPNGGAQ
ncbi:hypothetical protein FQN54_002819 [Arachnomyces sp. PD_36]|nr:hypothetical protein FQN54_002819 [Arachnomyces sp. PD_36]